LGCHANAVKKNPGSCFQAGTGTIKVVAAVVVFRRGNGPCCFKNRLTIVSDKGGKSVSYTAPVYDWAWHKRREIISKWIEDAALKVGKKKMTHRQE